MKSLLSLGCIVPRETYSKFAREATDFVRLQEYFPLDRQIVPIPWDCTRESF
jgi:hypothetical protein